MLNEAQRETLQAVCDTVVPSIERPDDPHGFWARKASDLGVDAVRRGQLRADAARAAAGDARSCSDALAAQQLRARVAALARADPAQRLAARPAGGAPASAR